MRRPVLPVLAILLAACGGGESTGELGCEPGTAVPCACEGGGSGTATCGADGTPGSCLCPGAVSFAPVVLDFGSVPLDSAREATLLLWTDGDVAVPVTSVSVEGTGFAVTSIPDRLPAGGAGAPVVVSFASAVPVEAVGTLRIGTGAGEVAVPLRAAVYGPAVRCSPDELSWTGQPVGVAGAKPITCTNVGLAGGDEPALLRLAAVTFDDPDFSVERLHPGDYGPGETFSFDVVYRPREAADDAGTARIEFEDVAAVSVPLSGTTIRGVCVLEPAAEGRGGVPGQELQGSFRFANHRVAGCLVTRVERDPACDEGFEFELPEPRIVLAGETLEVPYRFSSATLGTHACAVKVFVDDDEGSEFTAEASLDLSWRPCLVAEGPTVVPEVSPSCGTSELWTVVRNACGGDFVIDGARLVDGSAPGFTVGPIGPVTLTPEERLAIPVRFDASTTGAFFGATVEVTSPLDPEPWAFAVVASSGPDDFFTNRYVQKPLEPIDVLVVIDDGAGMGPVAARLAAELGPAPDLLNGYDYHLAVTTTGLAAEAGAGCPGGADGGEDGRLFPVDGIRPRIVTRATPDARAAWEANLQVGACRAGASQPLAAAALAVSPALAVADDPRHPEANDGNAGFLRDGVPLVVAVITNRDDASAGAVAPYLQALIAAKNGDPTLVNVVTIAGDPDTGCSGSGVAATPGDRLHDLAVATSAASGLGLEISICDAAWGFLNLFNYHLTRCFPVSEPPADRNEDGTVDAADLEVRVALAAIPAIDLDGRPNWTWNPDQTLRGYVCFSDGALPPGNALVEIERLYCPLR